MKILIVEDEILLSDSIVTFLKELGYRCEVAANFESANEKINLYDYDCLVVDITLPDGSGLDIIDSYKKAGKRGGVIVVSARNSLGDKITGLDLGADDYLTKPFHLHELSARINSVIRRLNFNGESNIELHDISIKPAEKEVSIDGSIIHLTKTEYDLLLFFMQNERRVISKSAIAEHLYGDNADMADSYDFIYSQIKNLRRKLNSHSQFEYIHAVYGVGYKLLKS